MRAAIIAGGRTAATKATRAHLSGADLLICADGGLRTARRLGLRPDVAIGDFDSSTASLLAWARRQGARIIPHPAQKDKTDTELALDYAAARGVRDVDLFGALGGRLDHQLANVGLLLAAKAKGLRMRIVDGRTAAFLAVGRTAIPGTAGDLVSLLPLSRTVSGATTHGLKYPLRGATLREGSTLGVSNEVISRAAAVTVRRGDLLIVLIHGVGTRARGAS